MKVRQFSFQIIFLSYLCIAFAEDEISENHITIERILYKRDALENMLKDDPKSRCRNGGIYAGGQCHCIFPHTGPSCQDFACVHGISVGKRFDPNSLFFSTPCICNDGWKGDLCQYHLTDRCNNRGEWNNTRCDCIGHFFGDECQYTSRCDFGHMKHGRCVCDKDFVGDYCERIVCHHGYADVKNNSQSCVCPAKYKGVHCNECSQTGPKIQPYPTCVIDLRPYAKSSRTKTNQQIKSRMIIMISAVSFLVVIGCIMFALHIFHKRRRDPEVEAQRMQALAERQTMLQEAAMKSEEEVQITITKKERKRSITNPFRFSTRKSSSTGAQSRNSTQIELSTPRQL